MTASRIVVLSLASILFAAAAPADEPSVQHDPTSQKSTAIDVEIVSVKPSGIRNHFQDWVAVGRVPEKQGEKERVVFLYMHSPVRTFSVPAEEAVGRRFRVIVERQRGEHVFKFEVDRDDFAK